MQDARAILQATASLRQRKVNQVGSDHKTSKGGLDAFGSCIARDSLDVMVGWCDRENMFLQIRHSEPAADAIAVWYAIGSAAPQLVIASSSSTPVFAAVSPKRESGV